MNRFQCKSVRRANRKMARLTARGARNRALTRQAQRCIATRSMQARAEERSQAREEASKSNEV